MLPIASQLPRSPDCGDAAAADDRIKIVDGVAVQLVEADAPGAGHTFQLDRVYGQNATQEDVYGEVAHETVENVMEGYNGTIFACATPESPLDPSSLSCCPQVRTDRCW